MLRNGAQYLYLHTTISTVYLMNWGETIISEVLGCNCINHLVERRQLSWREHRDQFHNWQRDIYHLICIQTNRKQCQRLQSTTQLSLLGGTFHLIQMIQSSLVSMRKLFYTVSHNYHSPGLISCYPGVWTHIQTSVGRRCLSPDILVQWILCMTLIILGRDSSVLMGSC